MGQLLSKSCCKSKSTNEQSEIPQSHYHQVPVDHIDQRDATDTGEAPQITGTVNAHVAVIDGSSLTAGTGTSECSQKQAPALGEGDQTTGTGTNEHSQIKHLAPGEGDQTTGSDPSEHSHIQTPAPVEGNQPRESSTREANSFPGDKLHVNAASYDRKTADKLTEMGQLLSKSCCKSKSTNEQSEIPQSHYHQVPVDHIDQRDATDTGEAPQITGTVNAHAAVNDGSSLTAGTGTSECSQKQAPALGEGDQTTGTGTNEHSQIKHPAPGEGDQTTGSDPSEHSHIQTPAAVEGNQPRESSTREANPFPGDKLHVNAASYDRKTADKLTEMGQLLSKSCCKSKSTNEQSEIPQSHYHQVPVDHIDQRDATDTGEAPQITGTVNAHVAVNDGSSLTAGTGTSECSQKQAPALGEGDQTTGTGTNEHSQIKHPAPGEGDQTTGSDPSEHSHIQTPAAVEGNQPRESSTREANPFPGDKLHVNAASYDRKTGYDPFDCVNVAQGLTEIPSDLKDVEQKHKETLRVQTETLRVNTILIKEKVKIFQLVDRYAELTIIPYVRDRTLVEHELLARGRDHEEWREKSLQKEKIRTDQLFQNSSSGEKSKSGSSAAVTGVPGIGKTTMVQKIVSDWATGKIYIDFQFVFSFKFRDLNVINCKTNLRNLIQNQYPYFGNVLGKLWKNAERLLFIFDGLDEFKDKINFADNRRNAEPQSVCTDPEYDCEVSDIVCSLMQHKLLPGCSVLVTSRPTALDLLEKTEISVWAEILGFVGDERMEYFNKFFEDQAVAAAVFKHVEQNEILYTMCYNPSCCWILGLSLGPFFTQRDRKQQQVPKTLTQLYSYYIYNILKNHSPEIENPRDVLLKLGKMAFTGISEKKILFKNADLIKYNLQPSQFLSGFLIEHLERDDSTQSVVYTFSHLTIQEFVAALTQFLTPDLGDIPKLLSEADIKEDGRFEIVLRFVAGLSSPQAAQPLEEFLGPFCHQATQRVIDWVTEKVTVQIGNTESETDKRKLLNTFHYLFESRNKEVAAATVSSAEILMLCGLTLKPVDCFVLSHVIGLCDTIKELNLESCCIHRDGFQHLRATIHKCQVLRLKNNKLGDSGVKELLSAALREPDCKIQKLDLWAVDLTDSCAEDLASALNTNRSLTVLNLGSNAFTDQSARAISRLIQKCKSLELIWLVENQFCSKGKYQLTSVQDIRYGLTVRL